MAFYIGIGTIVPIKVGMESGILVKRGDDLQVVVSHSRTLKKHDVANVSLGSYGFEKVGAVQIGTVVDFIYCSCGCGSAELLPSIKYLMNY